MIQRTNIEQRRDLLAPLLTVVSALAGCFLMLLITGILVVINTDNTPAPVIAAPIPPSAPPAAPIVPASPDLP